MDYNANDCNYDQADVKDISPPGEATDTISLSINHDIIGKDNSKAHLSSRMRYASLAPSTFAEEVAIKGKAWSPGVFPYGQRKAAQWSQSELLALDFDKDTPPIEYLKENHPFKAGILLIHETASSTSEAPRYRVVFRLPKPIRDKQEWRSIAKQLTAVTAHEGFTGNDDGATHDLARFFYGNKGEVFYLNPQAVLDTEALQERHQALPEPTPQTRPTQPFTGHTSDEDTIRLCLQYLPRWQPEGSGWYSPHGQVLFPAVVHTLGVEHGFVLLTEVWGDYPRDKDLEVELSQWEGQPEGQRRTIGSLIHHIRHTINEEDAQRFSRELSRISQAAAPGRVDGLAPGCLGTGEQPSDEVELRLRTNKLAELLREAIAISLNTEPDASTDARLMVVKASAARIAGNMPEVNRRIMEGVMRHQGYDVTGSVSSGSKPKTRAERRAAKRTTLDWLIPDLLVKHTSMVLYSEGGVGKTRIALDMARSLLTGKPFGDSLEPCKVTGKKVLFIGSDGGPGAADTLDFYLSEMGAEETEWDANLVTLTADEDTAAWTLNPRDIERLRLLMETGEYDLVIIDSMEAVTQGTDWSVYDPIFGQAMRWIEYVVCKHAAILWIHHTNKGNSSTVHKAKGCTEITSTPSGIVSLDKEGEKGRERYFFNIQKNRRGASRRFEFDPDAVFPTGCRAGVSEDSPIWELDPSQQKILTTLLDTEHHRLQYVTLVERCVLHKSTMSRHLKTLQEDRLVCSKVGKWELTPKGAKLAKQVALDAQRQAEQPF